MRVSVIIPNYNHAPYLRERIESVLSQTYTDFEVILIDDASTDDSRSIMEEYRGNVHVSHIIFNEQNSGNTFLQWQHGFSLAQGEYVWVAESDDAAEPDFLATLVGELDKNPTAVLAYSHSRMVGSQGEALDFSWHPKGSSGEIRTYDGPWFNRHRMLVQNHVYNASMVVFRRSAIAQVDADFCQYRYCGDWLFWVGICEQGDVIEACRVLNRYRQHPQKVTAHSQLDGRKWRDIAGILRHFITLFHLTPLQQRCLRGRWTKRFNKENGKALTQTLAQVRSENAFLYAGTFLDVVLYEMGKGVGFLVPSDGTKANRRITWRKRKRMYILCANDRFNYGDLLFPYILEYEFADVVDDFVICSTTSSDMRSRGALPTKKYTVLKKLSFLRKNYLVIGGGECIFCDWETILGYVDEHGAHPNLKELPSYPFTIGKWELKHLDAILYNSVGCHQLNDRKDLYGDDANRWILESADYIAVRDTPTSLGMSRMKLVHYLCADSAILMSRLYSRSCLETMVSDAVKQMQRNRYLFFQMGLQHLKGNERKYAAILQRVWKETGLRLCLCPIGTALGHDDPQALSIVAQYLPKEAYMLMSLPSVWDIMSLIASANIYVGSSLHGAITAMSYEVPLIGFGPRKLQVYIETWYDTIGSEYSFVSLENLESAVLRRIQTRFIISPQVQIASVDASFARMRSIIKKD